MKGFKFLTKEKISRLLRDPGVYCFKNEGEILYIGKAANLKERVKNHFQQPGYLPARAFGSGRWQAGKDYLFLDKI